MGSDVDRLVGAAKTGNREALESLVSRIQDKLFGLALRMLYDPSDAEDASQEILLKIITHLGTFRGESSFYTWMYRVAANHLLTARKRRAEREAMSFEEYEKDLDLESAGEWEEARSDALQNLFIEEIRIGCLQGLLLCLDRDHRLAYLLADVFDVGGQQGASILDITPAAFRKRLSRARKRIQEFLTKNCALIDPKNPCWCERHVASQLDTDRFQDENLVFAKHPCRIRHDETALNRVREMDELNRIGFLFKQYPDYRAPAAFIQNIRHLLKSDRFDLLKA